MPTPMNKRVHPFRTPFHMIQDDTITVTWTLKLEGSQQMTVTGCDINAAVDLDVEGKFKCSYCGNATDKLKIMHFEWGKKEGGLIRADRGLCPGCLDRLGDTAARVWTKV